MSNILCQLISRQIHLDWSNINWRYLFEVMNSIRGKIHLKMKFFCFSLMMLCLMNFESVIGVCEMKGWTSWGNCLAMGVVERRVVMVCPTYATREVCMKTCNVTDSDVRQYKTSPKCGGEKFCWFIWLLETVYTKTKCCLYLKSCFMLYSQLTTHVTYSFFIGETMLQESVKIEKLKNIFCVTNTLQYDVHCRHLFKGSLVLANLLIIGIKEWM